MNDNMTHGRQPRRRIGGRYRAKGFTLIELMIVVAIIAILAAIAYASYNWAVVKSRRNTAAACVLEKAQFMERFYTTNLRYDEDLDGNAVALPALDCDQELAGHYNIEFNGAVGTNTYDIRAVPQNAQATQDAECGTLSVDETGAKGVTGAAGVADCW